MSERRWGLLDVAACLIGVVLAFVLGVIIVAVFQKVIGYA